MGNVQVIKSIGGQKMNEAYRRVESTMLRSLAAENRVVEKRPPSHLQIAQRKQNQDKDTSKTNSASTNQSQSNETNSDGDEDGDDGGGDDDSDRQGSKHSQSLKYQYQARPQQPQQGFIRLREILQVIPISKSTWWAGVKSGRYPQPVRSLGKRITAWRVEDIQSLINDAF